MSTELREGDVFAGRYRVVSRIASGGMGSVYEVIHLETSRRRALKVMHRHILQSDEMRDRFKREARVTAEVESEFVVDVFDAGVDESTGMPFLVMELLRGEEIGRRLRRLGRIAPADVVTYLSQTAFALDKTHAASIVHRDLKPENLFLTQRDDGSARIKILDFGVAKLVAEGSTQGGATSSVGTPLYMAPEQFKADTVVSPASDIYALGMIAYTLLVGQPYWAEESKRGANVFAFALLAVTGPTEPASARALRAGVPIPPSFDAWFATVTALDPARRFPRASLAAAALAEALGVASVAAPAPVGMPSAGDGVRPPAESSALLASGDFVASGSTTASSSMGLVPASPPASRARAYLFAVAVGLLLGSAGIFAMWRALSPADAPRADAAASSSAQAAPVPSTPPADPVATTSASAPEPAPAADPPASAAAGPSAPAPRGSVSKPRLPARSRYSPD